MFATETWSTAQNRAELSKVPSFKLLLAARSWKWCYTLFYTGTLSSCAAYSILLERSYSWTGLSCWYVWWMGLLWYVYWLKQRYVWYFSTGPKLPATCLAIDAFHPDAINCFLLSYPNTFSYATDVYLLTTIITVIDWARCALNTIPLFVSLIYHM